MAIGFNNVDEDYDRNACVSKSAWNPKCQMCSKFYADSCDKNYSEMSEWELAQLPDFKKVKFKGQ